MPPRIELLDCVALLEDLPDLGLSVGEVGAVVEVLGEGEAFEVEFVDPDGRTYGLHTLKTSQLIALHNQGQPSGYASKR